MTSQLQSSRDQLTFAWRDSERPTEERVEPTPLFPFGHGRSYTTFEIENLRLSSNEIPTDGEVTASVRVRNTGARAGEEVVQLYLHDVVASVTRPVKQLADFIRVHLGPGEETEVSFRLHADRTTFTGRDLQRIVEPGDVDILVGRSAGDLHCRARGPLTGPIRVVDDIMPGHSGKRSAFALPQRLGSCDAV